MRARDRIDSWFQRLNATASMAREDVCFLMVQSRHLIEVSGDAAAYRTVSFYADWVVHSALDRSPVCLEVLRDITAVIAANFNPTGNVTAEVSSVIGLPRLRAELTRLFQGNDLPIVIFRFRENWKGFVAALLWFIEGQPIGFPEPLRGKAKEIHAEMLALPRPRDFYVETLAVVTHNNAYHWLLQLGGEKAFSMMGQMELAEPEERFDPPPSSEIPE